MSPHQILIVVIRLIAVVWLLYILGQIGGGLAVMEEMGAPIFRLWMLVAVQAGLCAVLWFFPATIASKLLKSGNLPPQKETVDFAQWRQLALVIIGVFVLARAIPDAVYWVIMFVVSRGITTSYEAFGLEQKVNALVTVLELLIGLWLVLGARGIGTAIFRLRGAGLSTERVG